MDLKTINKRIAYIMRNTASMNVYVQETAVGILEHAKETGDCTAALRLVQALPKSYRRGLLINWFGAYSPIGMNVGTGKVGFHRPEAKAFRPFDIDAARINPWYDSAEANREDLPDTTTDEAQKKIFGVAKGLQKRLDAGEVAPEHRDNVIDMVAALTALGKKVYRPKAVKPVNGGDLKPVQQAALPAPEAGVGNAGAAAAA